MTVYLVLNHWDYRWFEIVAAYSKRQDAYKVLQEVANILGIPFYNNTSIDMTDSKNDPELLFANKTKVSKNLGFWPGDMVSILEQKVL